MVLESFRFTPRHLKLYGVKGVKPEVSLYWCVKACTKKNVKRCIGVTTPFFYSQYSWNSSVVCGTEK